MGTRSGKVAVSAPIFFLEGGLRGRLASGLASCCCIPLPDNAQAVEGEKVVDRLDVFRSGADQRAQAASGNHFGVASQLGEQKIENAIHQAEVPVVEPGLQTAHSSRADNSLWFANLHPRQARRALEERVGGDAQAR